MSTAETAPTKFIEAANNVRFAYRRFGKKESVPIVMNIRFRGNMDHWDPVLVNGLAEEREVILFDNAGVGRSTGEVPSTFMGWAKDMIAFTQALGLNKIDLFGFSMGGLAAIPLMLDTPVIEAALAAPKVVRRLVIAGSTASVPSQGNVAGIVWPQESSDPKYTAALATAITIGEGREALKYGCFPPTSTAGAAADASWARLEQRTVEPPQLALLPMERGGNAQIASIVQASTPTKGGSFDRLGELKMPVLVMNGDDDVLIPTSRSWELLKKIENTQLIIYPRSGHGFVWQYANRVAEDVNRFLDAQDFDA